jgi:hypothetical protein
MRKHRRRPRPTGANQDKARTIAKFLRDEGVDVLTQDEWNNAADLTDLLSTATATEAHMAWHSDLIASATASAAKHLVVVQNKAGNKHTHIKLVPFDEIKMGTRRRYLIRHIIPRVGLSVVWGPPKSGKSFWVFDVVMHVALGWEYRGHRVHQGPVIYCAFEGQTGIEARVEAWRQRFLSEHQNPVPFYLQPVTINLVRDHPALIALIRTTFGEVWPVAIVLDTLNRSLHGSESSDEDMTAYVRAADAIREAFQCSVIVIHHCGIEGTRPRGHTSLTGAADVQLSVKRDTAENVIVEVECAKDGPQGLQIASRLEVVEVGSDDDGETISTCIIVPATDEEVRAAKPGRKLSDRHKLGLAALTECALGERSKPAPADWQLPNGIRIVEIDLWRDELFRQGTLDRGAKNPRVDFRRLKDALKARHLIGERDGFVWLA